MNCITTLANKKNSVSSKVTDVVCAMPPIISEVANEIPQLKLIFNKLIIFSIPLIQKEILDFLGDDSWIKFSQTLSEFAYMSKEGMYPPKGFFLPIVSMSFCQKDKQLKAIVSGSVQQESNQSLTWDLHSGRCIKNSCMAYFDVHIESARPPKTVQAISKNKKLKALVTHEFYPNDDEYPAPGNGAYRPQYQATVEIGWNFTYKDLLAYIFSKMGTGQM